MSDDGTSGGPEMVASVFQKGGTGKTFTAKGIAGGLAARGFEVLLVDLDQSGNLTTQVGYNDLYRQHDILSLDEVLMDTDKWSQIDDVILTDHPEFDLIPANTTFQGNKTQLNTQSAADKRFRKAAQFISKDYDYIIMDTPPTLDVYGKNAIAASGNLVVAMKAREELKESLHSQWDQCRVMETVYDDLTINILAYTLGYDARSNAGEQSEMRRFCKEEKTLDEFDRTIEPLIEVDQRAAFGRAKEAGRTIYEHEESLHTDQVPVFDQVVQKVIEGTSPPEIGTTVEKALALTVEDIRANSEE